VRSKLEPNLAYARAAQEVKELVRGTRAAVRSAFLGALESFLVYLECLTAYCEAFMRDDVAIAAMKVASEHLHCCGCCLAPQLSTCRVGLMPWP
jgi:hypothetical protein